MSVSRIRTKPKHVWQPARRGARCRCDEAFDARAACEALARDLTRIVDLLPELTGGAAAAPPPGARGASEAQRAAAAAARARPAIAAALRIVGGEATDEFPACCCVGDADRWSCSGVLIRDDVVLTAAHCGPYLSRVLVGATSIEEPGEGEVIPVRRVMAHEAFDRRTGRHDLSLLRLERAARVAPVPVVDAEDLASATDLVLVGFGYDDPSRLTGFGTKRKVTVSVRKGCTAADQDALGFFADAEIVAGRKELGRDTCKGDSGGPAFVDVGGRNYRVAGITSRPTRDRIAKCGDGGIYVRPDAYMGWIRQTLGE
jgi:endonuclease G